MTPSAEGWILPGVGPPRLVTLVVKSSWRKHSEYYIVVMNWFSMVIHGYKQ